MDQNIPYPEMYMKIYPIAQEVLSKYYPYEAEIYDMPSQTEIDKMIDEVYDKMINDYPEIENDTRERRAEGRGISSQQRPYYGRRRLFRNLIGLILLGGLLNRRRCRGGYCPGYNYPGYGYPGYGYPGYGYPYY